MKPRHWRVNSSLSAHTLAIWTACDFHSRPLSQCTSRAKGSLYVLFNHGPQRDRNMPVTCLGSEKGNEKTGRGRRKETVNGEHTPEMPSLETTTGRRASKGGRKLVSRT